MLKLILVLMEKFWDRITCMIRYYKWMTRSNVVGLDFQSYDIKYIIRAAVEFNLKIMNTIETLETKVFCCRFRWLR